MISADELASIRAVADSSLPDSGTILRRTQVSDSMGGFSETWAAVGTASCRVSPAMVQNVERISADRMVSVTSWVISFPSGTDVTAKDRIQSQSAAYEVTAPMTPHSDAAVCRVQAVMAL